MSLRLPSTSLRLAAALALSAVGACSKPAQPLADPPEETNPHCAGGPYVAFSSANLADCDRRAQALDDITAAAEIAELDPARAAAQFAAIESLYTSTAGLQAAVQGRRDARLAAAPVVGDDLDALVTKAIADGKAATGALQVTLAKVRVEKTLLRFFALSVLDEMSAGTRPRYDAAFGYFGGKPDNAEAHRQAVAAFASEVDGAAQTQHEALLFGMLDDGQCELDKGLAAKGAEHATLGELPDYEAVFDKVGIELQKTFAQGLARPVVELKNKSAEAAQVDLAEAEALFAFLEPAMTGAGGDKGEAATFIRAELKKAEGAAAQGSATWNTAFDADGVTARLKKVYAVTLQ